MLPPCQGGGRPLRGEGRGRARWERLKPLGLASKPYQETSLPQPRGRPLGEYDMGRRPSHHALCALCAARLDSSQK